MSNDFQWPNLAVLLLSYKRPEQAIRTINGIAENLAYRGEISWYIADDGTDEDDFKKIIQALKDKKQNVINYHSKRFSPKTGKGWNKGLGICHQYSDFVLVMEDDWELSGKFDMNPDRHPGDFKINPYLNDGKLDINPYIEMLMQREDVGLVRLSGLAVGNNVKIVGHNGHHYLKYHRDEQYAFSGNPHIRHARFTKAYGWYSEDDLNPGELELNMDGRFRAAEGPDIWRPSDIPGWGIFHHIGEVRYR
jgi:hypothetical protein